MVFYYLACFKQLALSMWLLKSSRIWIWNAQISQPKQKTRQNKCKKRIFKFKFKGKEKEKKKPCQINPQKKLNSIVDFVLTNFEMPPNLTKLGED